MYKNIFFDVDGTLIDPKEGITKSVQYALKKFNIDVQNLDDLECFIGPPLRDSFQKYYNFDDENSEKAVNYYREYFSENGINENTLYSGIEELLKELKAQNKVLIVATSKPTVFTEKILKNYGIDKYFDFVSGATLDKSRNKKEDIIQYALENLNIDNVKESIMIGDKHQDIIGANKNQMDSIGVLYGYGTKEELENENATYIVKDVKDIFDIIK